MSLEAFGVATGVVGVSEIGDKTQLLALASPRWCSRCSALGARVTG